MRVAGYIRVSTADQATHGYSLAAQTELIKRYCEQNHNTLVKIYADEGVSASKALHKRHGIISLLEDAESGRFDTIVFKDLTRWSRNPSQFYAVQDRLDKCKVSWIAIEQPNLETVTAQGRLMVGITISVSAHEAAQTSERLKFVFESRVKSGNVISGRRTPGYRIETTEAGKILVPDDNAGIVRAIFDHYEVSQSILETTRWANTELGFKTCEKSIRNMLRNEIYIGRYRNNDNYCEPLISTEQWNRVQALIGKRSYTAPSQRVYLFTGLCRCSHCGASMKGKYNGHTYYYRCANGIDMHTCPNTAMIREDKIEEYLLERVEPELKKYKVSLKKAKKKDPAPLKAKLNRVKELYIDGLIDRQEYDRRREAIEKELEQRSEKPLFDLPSDWKEIYASARKEAKKAAWRSVIDHIVIDGKNIVEVRF